MLELLVKEELTNEELVRRLITDKGFIPGHIPRQVCLKNFTTIAERNGNGNVAPKIKSTNYLFMDGISTPFLELKGTHYFRNATEDEEDFGNLMFGNLKNIRNITAPTKIAMKDFIAGGIRAAASVSYAALAGREYSREDYHQLSVFALVSSFFAYRTFSIIKESKRKNRLSEEVMKMHIAGSEKPYDIDIVKAALNYAA